MTTATTMGAPGSELELEKVISSGIIKHLILCVELLRNCRNEKYISV